MAGTAALRDAEASVRAASERLADEEGRIAAREARVVEAEAALERRRRELEEERAQQPPPRRKGCSCSTLLTLSCSCRHVRRGGVTAEEDAAHAEREAAARHLEARAAAVAEEAVRREAEAHAAAEAHRARTLELLGELQEMEGAMLEEAVGVSALRAELCAEETANELPPHGAKLVAALRAELLEARCAHELLRAAAEGAQALCVGFEQQLGERTAELREAHVCCTLLLAELRAADLRLATADTAAPAAAPAALAAGGVGIAIGEGWQVLQLQQELQAALAAGGGAQRGAAEAEEAVARQAAQHSLELQRERLRERHRALSPVKHSNL